MWRWCVQFTETCCAVLLEGTCDFDCFCRTAVHFPFICASPFGGGESSLRLRKSPWYELYKGQVQLDLLQVRIKTHNKLRQTNSASDRVLFQYNTFQHKSLLSHQGMRQEMSLPTLWRWVPRYLRYNIVAQKPAWSKLKPIDSRSTSK